MGVLKNHLLYFYILFIFFIIGIFLLANYSSTYKLIIYTQSYEKIKIKIIYKTKLLQNNNTKILIVIKTYYVPIRTYF